MTNHSRTGLLALAVTFSAGIHAALVPEHLKEMPPLGYAFIVAAAIGGAIAIALITRPSDRRVPVLAGLFCIGQIVTWGMFVTIQVPLFSGTPSQSRRSRSYRRPPNWSGSGSRCGSAPSRSCAA